MLIIRRRAGESILLTGGIEVHVLETSAGGAKIGITAPPEVIVLRNEVRLAGQSNLQAATAADSPAVQEFAARLRLGSKSAS